MNDGRDAALLAGSGRPAPADPNMIWIPGGTFRMGSDKHYPEEAPATASRSTASGSTGRR
jgi:formylglycine-generating enzyme required for sulfatase activity